MSDLKTMSNAVMEVIDNYPIGHQFYGNQLKDDVVRIFPESKDDYVDSMLRMMRRHRSDAYRTVNHNRSLYERVKSFSERQEEIRKEDERKAAENKQTIHHCIQGELPLFCNHVFLVVFLGLLLGLLCSGEPAFGCPLTDRLFNISKSSSDNSYIAFTPIYRTGLYPARFNLWRVASVDTGSFGVPIFWAISKTVNSIIRIIYRQRDDQSRENVQISDILLNILYTRIVVLPKFNKNFEIYCQNLDDSLRLDYIVYM